jgi:sugar phosphate isomerase/epimerase
MNHPDLLGCYWTLGGNYVFGDHDHSPWDFRARVEAAARAGYTGCGLKHADLIRTLQRYGYTDTRALLADNGMRHLELEALFDWFADGPERARSDLVRHDLLTAAQQLGARHIKVAGDFSGASWPLAQMHDAFQELAEQARRIGVLLALEPIPFSSIPDLRTGLAVLGAAAGHGAGLMLDTWHVTRGAMALTDIAALPRGFIAGAELDDGTLATIGTPIEDTLNRRRLCGDGEFDIHGFIAAVSATGYNGPWGVEIISAEQRARPLEQAAQLSFQTALRHFQQN